MLPAALLLLLLLLPDLSTAKSLGRSVWVMQSLPAAAAATVPAAAAAAASDSPSLAIVYQQPKGSPGVYSPRGLPMFSPVTVAAAVAAAAAAGAGCIRSCKHWR